MAKNEPKDKRIKEIIEAAIDVFLEKGYEGATIDSIAKKAGVSKGGFYHYFPDKEVLLLEANSKLSEPLIKMAETAMASHSAINGLLDYIRSYLLYWKERPRELGFFYLSMAKSLESEPLMAYYKTYMVEVTEFYTYMIKRANDEGDLSTKDQALMGVLLMGAIDGIMNYLVVFPDSDIDSMVSLIESIWLD
ncbi:MAG: TetR/AcrR family transcriptional regulator [Vallitaleaceae bacterium]|jgi:AcrR family transcriptional regulator|nr:TetR/AcrR family transcriptional regulator [Vallitaleaceae bacterium]